MRAFIILLMLACGMGLSSCNHAEEALQAMDNAEKMLEDGYYIRAVQQADESLKLDSTESLLFRRAMLFIEAGEIMVKNDYKDDAERYFRRAIRDMQRIETFYEKNGKAYYYRAVARSRTYDKVGACQDIYQAEAYGKRVPQKVKDHAECEHIERLTARSELNATSGPTLEDPPAPSLQDAEN
jgi:tetratricopeptide (TPR) repeat protein